MFQYTFLVYDCRGEENLGRILQQPETWYEAERSQRFLLHRKAFSNLADAGGC